MVLGPSLVPPSDAGSVFIRVIDTWTMGPWCSDESDSARAALAFFHNAMFDGSTHFISKVFRVAGQADVARSFVLREGLDEGLDARRQRGRDLMAMAQLAVRAAIPLGRATARYRHFVQRLPLPIQRSRSGITSEMAVFDELTLNRTTVPPYSYIPSEDSWASADGQVWWGLWLATVPPERLRDAFHRLVVRAGERYRAAHSEAFTDRVGWELRYRSAGERESDSGGGPSRKRRRGRGGRSIVDAPAQGPHSAASTAAAGSIAQVRESASGAPSHSASAGRGGGASLGGRGGSVWRAPERGRGRGGPVSSLPSVSHS